MLPLEYILFGVSILLLLNIIASKVSSRLGIPALLLFMLVGMLAGSEGPGGIHLDDPRLVQSIGVIALAYILFAGGLDTHWHQVRPVLGKGLALSTLGVFFTAVLVGWFAHLVLKVSLLEGMLLGAIVSSTDAAAVFAVLRSRNVSLKGNLKPLLELESGSNDPMAVFLTTGIIVLLLNPAAGPLSLVPLLIWQMLAGAALGYLFGKGSAALINYLRLEYEGLYPVLTLALVLCNYGATTLLQANGFLSVYVAGLVLGHSSFVQKKNLTRFHDGLAWLMQITMFLILGLQVFPSQLVPVIPLGLLIALFLMLVARPIGINLALPFSRTNLRERLLVSWVGLRGAVPIILATFPFLAGIASAEIIFNVVFFIVLTSALIQGASIPVVAGWLGLRAPVTPEPSRALEFEPPEGARGELFELEIAAGSPAVNKQIVNLRLPKGSLIVFIERDKKYLIPGGGTILEAGDRLYFLADRDSMVEIRSALKATGEKS